jgi:hypothetical protein
MSFQYRKILVSIGVLASLGGCAKMNFINGVEVNETVKRDQWHHSGLLDLIEFSAPVKINYLCDDKQWDTITIEKNFANIVASTLYIYTPWIAHYECRENIDY